MALGPALFAPRRLALFLAAVIALSACAGGGDDEAAPTTTAQAPTTAAGDAYKHPDGASPLTGMPMAGSPNLSRPALVVKIDNAPKARPQVGINQADLVVEEKVEDGVTRFFVVFHSADVPQVGPVRSVRSTDILLAGPLNRPLFSYSGGNRTFKDLIAKSPMVDVGYDSFSSDYRRDRGRPGPYNLFSTTPALYARAPAGAGPPPPQFRFRATGSPIDAASPEPGADLHIEFLGDHVDTIVDWRWDPKDNVYRRFTDTKPHVDAAGTQVGARTVIVQITNYKDTGIRDQSNTIVPEAELIGSGEAWVLSDGKVVKGTWSKKGRDDLTVYADKDGAQVKLAPGQVWIELAPPSSARVR